jgi:hypothetical protein
VRTLKRRSARGDCLSGRRSARALRATSAARGGGAGTAELFAGPSFGDDGRFVILVYWRPGTSREVR